MYDNRRGGSVFGAFLLGGIVGATLGLLFAPRSGKETREVIAEKAEEYWGEGVELYHTGKDKVVEIYDASKDKVVETYDAGREKVVETGGQLREKIDEARGRLQEQVAKSADAGKEKLAEAVPAVKEVVDKAAGATKSGIETAGAKAADTLDFVAKKVSLTDAAPDDDIAKIDDTLGGSEFAPGV